MLDQNTDRMWYVIGAIVIGAAIIAMGLNIFSDSFESVDDNFATLMTQVVDVDPPGKNYLLDTNEPKTSDGPGYLDYYLDIDEFNELNGSTVTVSFDAKAELDDMHFIDVYFRVHDGTIRTFNMSKPYALDNGYTRYTYTMKVPSFDDYLEYRMSLRFRGNIYVPVENEEDRNKGSFTVRRVKMELGTNDSEYTEHESEKE